MDADKNAEQQKPKERFIKSGINEQGQITWDIKGVSLVMALGMSENLVRIIKNKMDFQDAAAEQKQLEAQAAIAVLIGPKEHGH